MSWHLLFSRKSHKLQVRVRVKARLCRVFTLDMYSYWSVARRIPVNLSAVVTGRMIWWLSQSKGKGALSIDLIMVNSRSSSCGSSFFFSWQNSNILIMMFVSYLSWDGGAQEFESSHNAVHGGEEGIWSILHFFLLWLWSTPSPEKYSTCQMFKRNFSFSDFPSSS